MGGQVVRKGEVAAQKKNEHENRNALIVGLLLALIPFFILLLVWVLSPSILKDCSNPPGDQIGGAICGFKILLYGVFPTFYLVICLPLGALSFIISASNTFKAKFKRASSVLRFLGKSLLIGGVLGLVFTIFLMSSVIGLFG